MMRKLFGLLVAAALATALTGAAHAATFQPTQSELIIKISGLASIRVLGLGSATDNVWLIGDRGVWHRATAWSTVGYGPGTSLFTGVPFISNLTVTVKNSATGWMTDDLPTAQWTPPGTPNPVGPGTIATGAGGTLPIAGSAKIAITAAGSPAGKIAAPLSILGLGGTHNLDLGSTVNGAPLAITITGGPWVTGKIIMTGITTNIVSLPGPNYGGAPGAGTITGAPFTLDPTNNTTIRTMTTLGEFITSHPNGILKVQHQVTLVGDNGLTSITPTTQTGTMTLVAPMRVLTTNLGFGNVPGRAAFRYVFTPEPSTLVLLAAGAGGLLLVGRKRMK